MSASQRFSSTTLMVLPRASFIALPLGRTEPSHKEMPGENFDSPLSLMGWIGRTLRKVPAEGYRQSRMVAPVISMCEFSPRCSFDLIT